MKLSQQSHRQLNSKQAAQYGISISPESKKERLLTPNEVGIILNVTGEAVKQWLRSRRMPGVKLANGYWKIRLTDLQRFVNAKYNVTRRLILILCRKEDPMDDVVEIVNSMNVDAVRTESYTDAMLKGLNHYPTLFVIDCASADSWKFAQKIRRTQPIQKVPILLTSKTALSDNEVATAMELSVQGFLQRPAQSNTMRQEFVRLLSNRK